MKRSRGEQRRLAPILEDLDRYNAHYAEVQRQKQMTLSDMRTVAQCVQRVVVEVVDVNGQDTPPYYCIPHEAPR